MISWRKADLIDTLRSKGKKTYPCVLYLVFPTTENGINESDRDDEYMGILDLAIDSNIPFGDYLAIRDLVNSALAPNKATIDGDSDDRRKFYSGPNFNMLQFTSGSLLVFENKIRRISKGPVTENLREYQNNDDIDRITISFSVEV